MVLVSRTPPVETREEHHTSYYNKFMRQLRKDWDIVDEGPMEDLLGIECNTNPDGSITLHQNKYINSVINRFFTPEERDGLKKFRVYAMDSRRLPVGTQGSRRVPRVLIGDCRLRLPSRGRHRDIYQHDLVRWGGKRKTHGELTSPPVKQKGGHSLTHCKTIEVD